jgi:hypothetical protein
MTRAARPFVVPFVALMLATLALPAAVVASSPTAATLTILDSSCSGAPGTLHVGDTVCARAVVTVSSSGSQAYRTFWYGPGAFSPTFQDVHTLSGSGTVTFEDAHQLTVSGVWSVRACKDATCASGTSILASKAFSVSGAPTVAPTSLSVGPAAGTYGETTTLSATLTSGGNPVANAMIAFTLMGGSAGSATTDGSGMATLSGAALGATGAGSYATGVGAAFAGTSTLAESSASGSLTVATAGSSTTVDCPASVTFTGEALEPCTASVTGGGGLDEAVGVTYQDNVDAGAASADATFAGDANHEPSSGHGGFAVDPASSEVSLTCPASVPYTGWAQTPCTASVTGPGGLDQALDVTYANNVLGTATASAAWDGDGNHTGSSASASFEIGFVWFGFDDPIQAGRSYNPGRTIPLKFNIGDGNGQVAQQLGSPTFDRSGNLGACDTTPDDATTPAATPDGGSPFKWTGGQYHYNWSTKGLTPGLYRVFASLGDGTVRHLDVCLSR